MTNSDTAFTISGNQKRKMKSASRLYAMQALFQMESSGQTSETICTEFQTIASALTMRAICSLRAMLTYLKI